MIATALVDEEIDRLFAIAERMPAAVPCNGGMSPATVSIDPEAREVVVACLGCGRVTIRHRLADRCPTCSTFDVGRVWRHAWASREWSGYAGTVPADPGGDTTCTE